MSLHDAPVTNPVAPEFSKEWDYLGFGSFPGAWNMARDLGLLEEFQKGTRKLPVIRLYRWEKPMISLGKNQDVAKVVNQREAKRLGYEIVKRPTGGRALLHKGDVCYAVVASTESHRDFRTLCSTYSAIGAAISQSLESLGITLTGAAVEGDRVRQGVNPCFGSVAPFEITANGRKICGSAQFRSGRYFLQHGSIRVRDSWDQDDLTALWPDGFGIDPTRITSVDHEKGEVTDFAEIERQLLLAFCGCFNVNILSASQAGV